MRVTLVVVGNVWLVITLVLVLGRCFARTEPVMYSFFHVGGWYHPGEYHGIVGLCLCIAIAHLVLSVVADRKRAND
ncbi:MAG TPA: hypothetical protein PLT20_12180 [Sedimentisphaerales bacterium]|nr:hypothetical protein [Sedimentisphaerales bacterium]